MENAYRNKNINTDTFVKTHSFCPKCGWEIIDCLTNFDVVTDMHGESSEYYDNFAYCGNKSCVNHVGVCYHTQDDPLDSMES